MGLFDIFRRRDAIKVTRSALDEADDPTSNGDSVTRMIMKLTSIGIDGVGPFDGAVKVADKALAKEAGDVEAAVRRLVRQHLAGGAAGGFVTSLGGFFTMVAALPANVFVFYVQATRLAAGIAHLRGHDVTDQRVRTAVLLTLVGSRASDILGQAGMPVGSGAAVQLAGRSLPGSALMVIQKAVGFKLLRGVGQRAFARVGKLVPVFGGLFGAGVDAAMMNRIADHARREFPARA